MLLNGVVSEAIFVDKYVAGGSNAAIHRGGTITAAVIFVLEAVLSVAILKKSSVAEQNISAHADDTMPR